MTRPATNSRAFTLLEVLLAASMVAVLAGSLYASLYTAFKARRSALSAVQSVRKCNQTLDLFYADLQSAVAPSSVLAGSFVGTSGQGLMGSGSDDLVFYAVAADAPPQVGAGDIKKIEYTCQASPESKDMILIRYITSNLLAPVLPEANQEIICRGVRAFSLRYFDGATWQDSWDSTAQSNQLPRAAEVTIELQGTGEEPEKTTRVLLIPCGLNCDPNTATGASS